MHRDKRRGKILSYMPFSQILSELQMKACKDKFDSYKVLGSTMLGKYELKCILAELDYTATEEELLEMINQADPNGHGYLSYTAFESMINHYKQVKEETVGMNIGLTFDLILQEYRREKGNDLIETVSWEYIQRYLEDNFGIEINVKSLQSSRADIKKNDFLYAFS